MTMRASILHRHHATLAELARLLEGIPDAAWTAPPAPGAWAPAEVYDHLGKIADGYVGPRLADCLEGRGRTGSPSLLGHLFLWMGSLPGALRVKAPFPPELLPKRLSKDEARALLSRLGTEAGSLAPRVAAADPAQRTRHFRLGWLNAEQWFAFLEMHHRHHLEGQLKRLLR